MTPTTIVVFGLEGRRYGLPLPAVDRVARVVDVLPLPKAPDVVRGVVNVRGRVVPVIDLRRRFRLPGREPMLTDQLIIARTPRRALALVVDAVDGVIECAAGQVVGAADIVPGVEHVEGVARLADGLVLIQDLDRFLSLDEEAALDRAIEDA